MNLDSLQSERIYTEYRRKVTSYIRGKINNPHDAEDLVSEVFVKIYGKLDTFDETKASLSTWIYHITQNTVIDYYRRNQIFEEIPMDASAGGSIEEDLENNEMLEKLADALKQMDEKQRNIIILHYYKGLKLKDVAEGLGISYVYAKVLHKKALAALREFL